MAEPDSMSGMDNSVTILIPLFNDWIAVGMLLSSIDSVCDRHAIRANVLIVDDGSTESVHSAIFKSHYDALTSIHVIELRRNLGHQRAIAIGLAHLEQHGERSATVVMDSDGEDDPNDIPRLIQRCREEGNNKIVFAERTQRSESIVFRTFYTIYKWLHFVLTGYAVRVGNFSVVPRRRLESLVAVSELWNHFAAAVFKSKQPYCSIPSRRAPRLHGHSRMNFVSLVVHGLSAISVYNETIGVRMMIVALSLVVFTVVSATAILAIRFGTDLAIPGWATYSIGILLVLFVQAVMLTMVFSFVTLGGRNSVSFLPRRDHGHFVNRQINVFPGKQ